MDGSGGEGGGEKGRLEEPWRAGKDLVKRYRKRLDGTLDVEYNDGEVKFYDHAGFITWMLNRLGHMSDDHIKKNPEPVVPGGANRVEKSDLPPANWFSVDYETVRAIAETHALGDKVYGMENWRKGLPVSNLLNHAFEHLYKFLAGDTDEQHLEHALWNLGKVRWMAKNHPELVDVPAVRRYFELDPPLIMAPMCSRCNMNPVDYTLGWDMCAGCYEFQTRPPYPKPEGA